MCSMLCWYYQEERGTSMAYTKAVELEVDDIEYLQFLVRTRTIQAQVVDRAKMLLYKARGESNKNIATRLDVNINTVNLCLSKFKEGGVQRALFDDQQKRQACRNYRRCCCMDYCCCMSASGRPWLFTGTLDAEKSASAHSESCGRSGFSTIKNNYKTHDPEDFEAFRHQTF